MRRVAMPDFIFRLSSVNLTDKQKQQVASAIQGAVLTELGKLDLTTSGSPSPTCLFVPIKWAGGIMLPPGDVNSVVGTTLTATAEKAT
jgi:hypothetical protein